MPNIKKLFTAGFIFFSTTQTAISSDAAPVNTPLTNTLKEKTVEINATIAALEEEKQYSAIYKAYFPSLDIARKAAISFHSELLETHYDEGYLVLELSPEDKTKLKAFNFRFAPADEFIAQRNALLSTMQENYKAALSQLNQEAGPSVLNEPSIASIPGYSCYETVEETYSAATSMVANYPNLAEWIDVGDSWEKEEGLGGYDIFVLKLSNKTLSGDKPKLFINTAIHAREYTTAPLNLAFATWLVEGYGENADATWLLDQHEIHLMLHTNPDGRKRAETGLLWRKNTNQNYCGSTSNNRGVDLNRNFTFTWNATNGVGSSSNQCSATYRGPSAGSEPEIQAIENYVRNLWPDRRGENINDAAPADTSGIHLDIHSYSELVLWPWGETNNSAPNGSALQTLGRKFAYFNDYTPQQAIGLYPTDGTSESVSYGELGVAAYTFELGTSFFQNCSTYQNTILPDNLEALIYAAKVVRTPYITPAGPDTLSLSLSDNAAGGGVAPGTVVTLNAVANDARYNNSNGSESTQNIQSAEYYLDIPPWEDGAEAFAMAPSDGNFNNRSESLTAEIDTSGLSLGKHLVFLRSRDAAGNWGAVSAIYLNLTDAPGPIDPTPTPEPTPAPGPIDYCEAGGNNAQEEWISQVSIGNFSNNSGSAGYSDFTNAVAPISLSPGSYPLSLRPQYAGRAWPEYWKIWIDLNKDGNFSTNEEVFSSGQASTSTVTGTLNIPSNVSGETRLRVAMRYNVAPSPCGSFNYGEVEDYTLEILE